MNRKAYLSILLALVFVAFAFLTGCSSGNSKTATGTTYVFYLSGQEAIDDGPNFYTVAGAVTIDSAGNVTAGEEDYNDGFADDGGILDAPTPISAGTLTVDSSTGQGTLALTVGDTNLGVGGVETLAIQFANANHALINQFDGSATSSGSLDLQSSTSAPGNFAFTFSGVDTGYAPIAIGGIVTVGSGAINGVFDVNDDGDIFTDQTLTTGTVTSTDAFGRGTITGTQLAGTIAYYVVGPEAVRLISDDNDAAGVGSAFGQGTATFTNASLVNSVFAVGGNAWGVISGMAGQFATSNTGADPANFAGVGEDNELENGVFTALAATFSGTYTVQDSGVNGYGSMSITSGFGDADFWGVYMTDPALNLSDPNNTSGGGGALVIDLSDTEVLPGVSGVLIPQTDTSTADFNGNYAVGWQDFNFYSEDCSLCEFDVVAQGSVTAASSNALSFTGDVSDPFNTLGFATAGEYTGATLTGTPAADEVNVGRYSLLSANENPLGATVNGESGFFDTTIYQASAGQLFWLNVVGVEEEDAGVFLGPLEQQGSLTGIPAVQKSMAKSPQAQKR
ncbi:MAG: hypothetical protein WCC78_20215 [Terriglobales bacterium]